MLRHTRCLSRLKYLFLSGFHQRRSLARCVPLRHPCWSPSGRPTPQLHTPQIHGLAHLTHISTTPHTSPTPPPHLTQTHTTMIDFPPRCEHSGHVCRLRRSLHSIQSLWSYWCRFSHQSHATSHYIASLCLGQWCVHCQCFLCWWIRRCSTVVCSLCFSRYVIIPTLYPTGTNNTSNGFHHFRFPTIFSVISPVWIFILLFYTHHMTHHTLRTTIMTTDLHIDYPGKLQTEATNRSPRAYRYK